MYEIGSEFHYEAPAREINLLELFRRFLHVEYLRCGRDAIGFIADDVMHASGRGAEAYTAFVPALSCDSMWKPFAVRGMRVEFYRLQKELTIDLPALEQQIGAAKGRIPIVLAMNFFGAADQRAATARLKEAHDETVLIEDVTHILCNPDRYDPSADYTAGSIRKWMGVPDGAAAIRRAGAFAGKPTAGTTEFTRLRLRAMQEKAAYLKNGDTALKARFRLALRQAEESLADGRQPFALSDVSREVLQRVDTARMFEGRTNNYRYLYRRLAARAAEGKYRLPAEAPENMVPFLLPAVLHTDKIHARQQASVTRDGIEAALAAHGVYAPVIWPIDGRAAERCPVSAEFSDRMLAFWIDHRYSIWDMERIAEVFWQVLNGGRDRAAGAKTV